MLMQVISLSPHALSTNAYMRRFLNNLSGYTPPAPNTFTHHLAELYSFIVLEVRGKLACAKEQYSGLPFLYLVTELLTENHTSMSFGSVNWRYVDPTTGDMDEVHLGVSLFAGRHSHSNINKLLIGQLIYFGLDQDEVASTMTDSGSSIRKALRQLPSPWNSCMAHSLHNSVVHALVTVYERPVQSGRGREESQSHSERRRNP